MKIDSTSTKAASPVKAASSATASSQAVNVAAPKAAAKDQVAISRTAAALKNVDLGGNDVKGASAERVQALRQAVKNGSFKADAAAIADKIINAELKS